MKTLLLLRHAKSSRDDPALEDFDRPLAERGREAAPLIGEFMRAHDLQPDIVICSPALRTRQTWDLVAPVIRATVELRFDKRLYLADSDALLENARSAPARAGSLLMIGHNPGLGELACVLTGRGAKRDRARLRAKFPTGALAVLHFDVARWREIAPGAGNLALLALPRELDAD
jgi:phosphohistidine phosphatase